MGLPLGTQPYYDLGGGLNVKYSPTKVPEDEASRSLNIDYSVDGAAVTRYGSTRLNLDVPEEDDRQYVLLMYDYRKSDEVTHIQISTVGEHIEHGLESPLPIVTGLSPLLPYPDMEFIVTGDDEYAVWGNGIDPDLKFNGTIYTNLTMPRPVPVTFAADGVGVLPSGTYSYYVSFVRTVTGVIVQESELSPVANHTIVGPLSINLVVPICTETVLPGVTAGQCNGRVIYRRNNTSGNVVRLTSGVTIPDNVTTAYNDNILDAALSTIGADFTVETTPTTKVIEEYFNRLFVVDAAQSTDVYYTPPNVPWLVKVDPIIFDGPVRCIKRIFGALIFGTDRSLWVLDGDITTTSPRRVSSSVGILNNRCAVGQDDGQLFIMSTNRKIYALSPTDFSQEEIRFSDPLSIKIDPIFQSMSHANDEIPCMESYTAPSVDKVMISVPLSRQLNNTLIIYNQSQSTLKRKPVWQIWDNINASALRQMTLDNAVNLYSGDFKGFFWKLDDQSKYGDGAEINGTVTSATTTTLTETLVSGTATSGTFSTLTDTALTMVVNAYVGSYIQITAGTGAGLARRIIANTATTFTVNPLWAGVPDATSVFVVGRYPPFDQLLDINVRIIGGPGIDQVRTIVGNSVNTLTISGGTTDWLILPTSASTYTVGGYDVYHYTNWKAVLAGYDFLKQLWFLWFNANASGNYSISLILQYDFSEDVSQQTNLLLNLAALNSIWGAVIWLSFIWGAQRVFEDRIRTFKRFRSMRIGFMHREAGQPFQINGFSITAQNKQLFFRST